MHLNDPQFDRLLDFLRESRGADFAGADRPGLMRRINQRMVRSGVRTYPDYLDFLEVHPEEFTALFDAVLTGGDGFFRDPPAWDHLRRTVLEPLTGSASAGAPIRVWSAGCGSGEEAYTIALLLAELTGAKDFADRVKIYATDIDEEQLARARAGSYGASEVAALPAGLAERYFDEAGARFVVRRDLRRSVIFGRHDLVRDAPISRIDVLACRNTLMYFTAEDQAAILDRVHFALGDSGVLFLGRSDRLVGNRGRFVGLDLPEGIFRPVPRGVPPRIPVVAPPPGGIPVPGLGPLLAEAFDAGPSAQLVVTPDGLVALANRRLEALFGVTPRDLGRPVHELEMSYRPVELRPLIERAGTQRRTAQVSAIEHHRADGGPVVLEIRASPLIDDSRLLGVHLTFDDVTAAHQTREEVERARQLVDAAHDELQATNEELETTNEELQSTVEELETTNEELQSSNEELETINGELRSANDELQSVNEKLRVSVAQLDETGTLFDTVLTGLRAGVAVLDRALTVRFWSRQAEDLWGPSSGQVVGRPFLALDIGLPVGDLKGLLRDAAEPGAVTGRADVAAVDRRGRPVVAHVICTAYGPVRDDDRAEGVMVIMEADGSAAVPDRV